MGCKGGSCSQCDVGWKLFSVGCKGGSCSQCGVGWKLFTVGCRVEVVHSAM